MPNAVS